MANTLFMIFTIESQIFEIKPPIFMFVTIMSQIFKFFTIESQIFMLFTIKSQIFFHIAGSYREGQEYTHGPGSRAHWLPSKISISKFGILTSKREHHHDSLTSCRRITDGLLLSTDSLGVAKVTS